VLATREERLIVPFPCGRDVGQGEIGSILNPPHYSTVGALLGGCLKSRNFSRLNLEFTIRGSKGSTEGIHG
jgi:hypothetical protein